MREGRKAGSLWTAIFSGNGTNAMAALLQSFALTDEQIKDTERFWKKAKRGRNAESSDTRGDGYA